MLKEPVSEKFKELSSLMSLNQNFQNYRELMNTITASRAKGIPYIGKQFLIPHIVIFFPNWFLFSVVYERYHLHWRESWYDSWWADELLQANESGETFSLV